MVRVPCRGCGTQTDADMAARRAGLCLRCHREWLQRELGQTPFGILYDQVHMHQLRGAGELYMEGLMAEENLAGPLSTLRTQGHCDYVFEGKHSIFEGIRTVPEFKAWCQKQIDACLKPTLELEATKSLGVERDLVLARAKMLTDLVDLACKHLEEQRSAPRSST